MNGDNWKKIIYSDNNVIDLTWVFYLLALVWVVIGGFIFYNYLTIDEFIQVIK